MLAAVQEVTGKEWAVINVKVADVVQQRGELIKQGRFPEVMAGDITQQLFGEGEGGGVTVEVGESDNVLLGVEMEDIVTVMKGLV